MAGRKSEIKKAQYYVCYLGWLETEGLRGHEDTDPVVYELLQRSRKQYNIPITKLTVQISKKEIKLTQEMEKGRTKVEKVKYPAIPAKDVTYACQGPAPDSDIVAAVYLGYNPQTRRPVHVHAYRCDSAETAARMVGHLNQLVDIPDHRHRHAKIEKELEQKGLINSRSLGRPPPQYRDRDSVNSGHPVDRMEGNSLIPVLNGRNKAGSTGSSGGSGAGSEGREAPNLPAYDSVAAELRDKLQRKNKQIPILLPPRDYDTISRSHGKVDIGLDLVESPPVKPRKVSNHSMGSRTSSQFAADTHYRNSEHNKTSDSGVDIPPDYEQQDDENVCNNSHGSSQLRMDNSRYEKHISRSSSPSSASDRSHDPSERQRYQGHQQTDDGYYSYDSRPYQSSSPRPQVVQSFYPVRSPPEARRSAGTPGDRRVKSSADFDMRRAMSPTPRDPHNRKSEPLSPREQRAYYNMKQQSADLGYSMPEKQLRKGLRRQTSEDRTSDVSRKSDPLPSHLQAKPLGRTTSFQVHR